MQRRRPRLGEKVRLETYVTPEDYRDVSRVSDLLKVSISKLLADRIMPYVRSYLKRHKK